MQLPDLDGLAVLNALESADQVWCPEIVFVTAYNAYMGRTFEVHGVNYLEKPYTTARFPSARARGRTLVMARRVECARALHEEYAAIAAPERASL